MNWDEWLTELERVDFELSKHLLQPDQALWVSRRTGLFQQMPVEAPQSAHLVRILQTISRVEELLREVVQFREGSQADARDLYRALVLTKALHS